MTSELAIDKNAFTMSVGYLAAPTLALVMSFDPLSCQTVAGEGQPQSTTQGSSQHGVVCSAGDGTLDEFPAQKLPATTVATKIQKRKKQQQQKSRL